MRYPAGCMPGAHGPEYVGADHGIDCPTSAVTPLPEVVAATVCPGGAFLFSIVTLTSPFAGCPNGIGGGRKSSTVKGPPPGDTFCTPLPPSHSGMLTGVFVNQSQNALIPRMSSAVLLTTASISLNPSIMPCTNSLNPSPTSPLFSCRNVVSSCSAGVTAGSSSPPSCILNPAHVVDSSPSAFA